MSHQPDRTPLSGQDGEDPFEIGTSVAHAARRYNYWLGGTSATSTMTSSCSLTPDVLCYRAIARIR